MASTPSGKPSTRIHVVSDVHGNARDLARAGEGADALICLGDLVLFLDYADHSRGIFPDLFGVENAHRIVASHNVVAPAPYEEQQSCASSAFRLCTRSLRTAI